MKPHHALIRIKAPAINPPPPLPSFEGPENRWYPAVFSSMADLPPTTLWLAAFAEPAP